MDRPNRNTTKLHVTSETGVLGEVAIGFTDNFHDIAPEIVNKTQEDFYGTDEAPTKEHLSAEFATFEECLRNHGVEVWRVEPVLSVPDQLTPRDIAFVVGHRLVIAGMAKKSRLDEWRGLITLLASIPPEAVLWVPSGILLEGGDVIVDKGRILVGLSQRTTYDSIPFLEANFPEYEVIPIPLRRLDESSEVLHLDCAFVPVGSCHALLFPPGLQLMPTQLLDTYQMIEVTETEQRELATNVLSSSPNVVVSRSRAERVNAELEGVGLKVCAIDFDNAPKTGGSFRCCSLPIRRADPR